MQLSEQDIEKDRQKWLEIISEMNKTANGLIYDLRRSEADGYWYITPETIPDEEIHLGEINKIKIEDTQIKFSDKQFENEYHSWIKNPNSNFILDNIPNNSKNVNDYVGRFSYHPFEKEFIFGRISFAHADAIKQFGNYEFPEYQRGIYVKEKKVVLLRPYYNPKDEKGNFNEKWPEFDQKLNRLVTNMTIDMLVDNGMPEGIKIVKNAGNDVIRQYTGFV